MSYQHRTNHELATQFISALCHVCLSVVVCETVVLVVGFELGGLAAPPPPAPSRKGRGRK
jgi:hypothetical protein